MGNDSNPLRRALERIAGEMIQRATERGCIDCLSVESEKRRAFLMRLIETYESLHVMFNDVESLWRGASASEPLGAYVQAEVQRQRGVGPRLDRFLALFQCCRDACLAVPEAAGEHPYLLAFFGLIETEFCAGWLAADAAKCYLPLSLKQSQEDLNRFFEIVPMPVVVTSVSGSRVCFCNDRAADVLEMAKEEMVGAYAPDYYVDIEERRNLVSQLLINGMVTGQEVRLRTAKGGQVWVLMSAVPLIYQSEDTYLFLFLDITRRKVAEAELVKLSKALEQSPVSVVITDCSGNIEYVNPAFERISGYSREEVYGKNPRILKSGRQSPEYYEHLWKTLAAGHTWHGELCNRSKSGREYWEVVSISPLRDGEGQATHYVAVKEDITKRKKSEEVLQERLQFIQTLMDAVPMPIFYKNIDGIYQGCNKAFEEYFGVVRPLLVGKTVFDISPSPMAEVYHKRDVQLARNGGLQVYESQARRKDGAMRDVVFHKAAYHDVKGNPVGIVGSVTDITARKLAEREAKENEAALIQVLEGIRAAIMIVEASSCRIEELNERACELLQISEKRPKNMFCGSLKWLDEQGRKVSDKDILRFQQDREYRLFREDGSALPVALTSLEATVHGMQKTLLILFDLTERRGLERRLNLAQKLEAVGQLAAGIAHEINTPIQYIGSNLSFLGEAFARLNKSLDVVRSDLDSSTLSELVEIPEAVRDAQDGVRRVSSIVQAMRKFSHPDTGEMVPLDVNEAVRTTVTIARNEWKYHSEVVLDLADDLPPLPCLPGDFNQVLLNIIVNAAHAVTDAVGESGTKGEIFVSTRHEGESVEIRIRDTGTGIAPENRNKIFDPFFTTKTVGLGTGQGLAITHDIVRRHGGSIDFMTELGLGTTFVLRFPLQAEKREEI